MVDPAPVKTEFFSTPKFRDEQSRLGEMRPKRVQEWLQQIPVTDSVESLQKIHQALYAKNRIQVEFIVRLEVLELFVDFLLPYLQKIQEGYDQSALPLSEGNERLCNLVTRILQELANGYKIILNEYIKTGVDQVAHRDLATAVFTVQKFLVMIVMNCYSVYKILPSGVWLDLHRVYRFAQDHRLLNIALDEKGEPTGEEASTLQDHYVNLLLLAAAEPKSMLPGECHQVFAMLYELQATARIRSRISSEHYKARFIIGLNLDTGPISLNKVKKFEPDENLRILDGVDVFLEVNDRLIILDDKKTDDSDSGIDSHELDQIDLLQRLIQHWGTDIRRKSSRSASNVSIKACNGINAIHHFATNPDKLRITDVSLPVAPEDPKPGGSRNNGAYYLDLTSEPESNGEILSVPVVELSADEVPVPANDEPQWDEGKFFKLISCRIGDESAGGLRLKIPVRGELRIHVGDIVGICYRGQKSLLVGSVRWLRSTGETWVHAGIQFIAPNFQPVMVRRADGSSDSPLFHALWLPGNAALRQSESLILPAGSYQLGQKLQISTAEVDRQLVVPIRMLNRTPAYDQLAARPSETDTGLTAADSQEPAEKA